ncbi:uncharacterized protein BKCO1_2800031 [Diplodia corticola]|uniref:Nephrocystin 3-like N-terminal domain-containing protein n=1 Tax=Diplodia corticola TaxID=236234 RepID=A0A1J9QZ48_9PEZI|nr:uncharacterized protein BKCO1_2800031 [Diplodia corticola]OJD33672.1 hypothetical protein BKCO1_2800031 [Diplodia corticola]
MNWTAQSLVYAFLIGVVTLLISWKIIQLNPPKPETPPTGERSKSSDSKTFRVQGLPAKHGNDGISPRHVEELVRKTYRVGEDIRISIGSLAPHPTRTGESVATLSFAGTPESLRKSHALDPASTLQVRLDDHFHGLTPLHSVEDSHADLVIVALSGLNGHAYGSFKRKGGEYMWLRDDLCRWLPKAHVYIYGYDTAMEHSDSFQTLYDLGASLKSTLTALLRPEDTNYSPTPLVLIGHSLGGLIVKEALCQMSEGKNVEEKGILKSLQAVLLFGTPNQGMNIESLIPMVDGQANELFVRSLGCDSAELRRQGIVWHRVFVERRDDKITPLLEVFSFYETMNSPTAIKADGKWKMAGAPAKLVDRNSATHGQSFDGNNHYVHPINRNHSELVKFTSPTDEVYSETVLPLLQKHYKIAQSRDPVLLLSQNQQKALDHCRSSLSFPEEHTRVEQVLVAENHTCTWFTKHPDFTDWLRNDRGLLWLHGLPGAGKSTALKHAVRSMEDHPHNAVVISFFIYGLGIDLQKTLRGICCSLLRQLLLHVPEAFLTMLSEARDKHEPQNWGAFELQEHLKQGLMKAARTRPIIIFIDALDEFSAAENERGVLVQFLRDLCYGNQYAGLRVKVCVSCRYYPNLFTKGIEIPAEKHNRNDIATFVRSSLEDLPEKKRVPLEEHIISSSDGVFQWTHLVCLRVHDLHRAGKPLKAILADVDSIPKELHSLYKRLLEEIAEEDKMQSLKLFRYVCFGKRRICLRELQHALVMTPDTREVATAKLAEEDTFIEDLEDIKNSAKYLSKGLIVSEDLSEIYRFQGKGWGERLRLIHVSVMDFMRDGGLRTLQEAEPHPSSDTPEGAAHYYISRVLLNYVFRRGIRNFYKGIIPGTSRDFPLDAYTRTSVISHIEAAESQGVDQFDLLHLFDWPHRTRAIENFCHLRNAYTGASLIHLLAAWGIMSALKPLIQYNPSDGSKTRYDSEISALLSRGTPPAGVLLASGRINLDLPDIKHAKTPLHYAIEYDKADVAHELLTSSRVDRNARANLQITPLMSAIYRGQTSIVEELLSSIAVDPAARDYRGSTAMHYCAQAFRSEGAIVKLLLDDPRFDPDARDKAGETPLHVAVTMISDPRSVPLLLASTRDINARNRRGETPLIAFVRYAAGLDASEHAELADVLVCLLGHPGIECRARDRLRHTALFYAATRGMEMYVGMLLERCGGGGGAAAADGDSLGRTPLSQAAGRGYLGIVEMMLGAEVLDAGTVRFAYQEAKREGREEVMRRLLETGKVEEN